MQGFSIYFLFFFLSVSTFTSDTCKMMLFLSSLQHKMGALYGEAETCRAPCFTVCYSHLCETKIICEKEVETNLKCNFYILIYYTVYLLPNSIVFLQACTMYMYSVYDVLCNKSYLASQQFHPVH